MDLSKEDVKELLNISEETLHRLIVNESIPVYSINQKLRFNREEIENWMIEAFTKNQMEEIGFETKNPEQSPWLHYGLYRAVHKGVVLETQQPEKEAIFFEVLGKVAEMLQLDQDVLMRLFLEREKLMPTALANGVAVPHTREFLLDGLFDVIVVVYLHEPISWGAIDHKPVHTLFFLFACDDKRHLSLLAKIAHLSSKEESIAMLEKKPSKKELLSYIKNWESSLLHVTALT